MSIELCVEEFNLGGDTQQNTTLTIRSEVSCPAAVSTSACSGRVKYLGIVNVGYLLLHILLGAFSAVLGRDVYGTLKLWTLFC